MTTSFENQAQSIACEYNGMLMRGELKTCKVILYPTESLAGKALKAMQSREAERVASIAADNPELPPALVYPENATKAQKRELHLVDYFERDRFFQKYGKLHVRMDFKRVGRQVIIIPASPETTYHDLWTCPFRFGGVQVQ